MRKVIDLECDLPPDESGNPRKLEAATSTWKTLYCPYTAVHHPPHPRGGGSLDVITDRLQEVLRDTLRAAFGNIREAQQ